MIMLQIPRVCRHSPYTRTYVRARVDVEYDVRGRELCPWLRHIYHVCLEMGATAASFHVFSSIREVDVAT